MMLSSTTKRMTLISTPPSIDEKKKEEMTRMDDQDNQVLIRSQMKQQPMQMPSNMEEIMIMHHHPSATLHNMKREDQDHEQEHQQLCDNQTTANDELNDGLMLSTNNGYNLIHEEDVKDDDFPTQHDAGNHHHPASSLIFCPSSGGSLIKTEMKMSSSVGSSSSQRRSSEGDEMMMRIESPTDSHHDTPVYHHSSSSSPGTENNGNSDSQRFRSNSLLSETELCRICSERAAKHIHYGGVTCFSCRAFFRRTIQNKSANSYICRRQGNCVINVKSRKNCQKCRFEKCIQAGMKPNWVLSSDERVKRFRKTAEKKIFQMTACQEDIVDDGCHTNTVDVIKREATNDFNPSIGNDYSSLPIANNFLANSISPFNPHYRGPEPHTRRPILFHQFADDETCDGYHFSVNNNAMMDSADSGSDEALCLVVKPPPTANLITKQRYKSTNQNSSSQRGRSSVTTNIRKMAEKMRCDSIGGVIVDDMADNSSGSSTSSHSMSPSAGYSSGSTTSSNRHPADPFYHNNTAQHHFNHLVKEPIIDITEGEILQIRRIAQDQDLQYRSVPFGDSLVKEMLMCSYDIPFSPWSVMMAYRIMIQRVTKIARAFPHFSDMSMTAQSNLLKQNADIIVSLRSAVFFESHRRGVDQILYSCGIEDIDVGNQLISTTIQRVGEIGRIEYRNFNSVQSFDCESETEKRYNYLLSRVGTIISTHVDLEKILSYVILFSADSAELDNRYRVETTQEMLINMLKRFIFSRNERSVANKLFNDVLWCIPSLKEMVKIKKMRSLKVLDHTAPAETIGETDDVMATSSDTTSSMEMMQVPIKEEERTGDVVGARREENQASSTTYNNKHTIVDCA